MTAGLDPARLFAGCEHHAAVLLAVSGGPDSMALLRLAAVWAAERPITRGGSRPALRVATVDHGLRPEAAAEAVFVADACIGLGLPHATLPWLGSKPATRRQERARQARYALLAAHAREIGASAILTAHHADDQAETILMRLGRGSGLAGLRGMDRETVLGPGLVVLRPLLGLPKEALLAVCRRLDQPSVQDPSNEDVGYARVRLRQQAEAAAGLGLDRDALLRLGRRMERAEAALQAESARVLRLLAPRVEEGRWRARLADLPETPPPEVLRRLLAQAIAAAAGTAAHGRPPRLDRLERLADALGEALRRAAPLRATLGGARLSLDGDGTLWAEREAPRRRGAGRVPGLEASHAPDHGAGSTQAPP